MASNLRNPAPKVVLIGAAVALGLGAGWFAFLSPPVREARLAGFPVPAYVTLDKITNRARSGNQLTGVEISALRVMADDAHPLIRARVLTALVFLKNTNQSQAGAEIARAKLHDSHSTVRQYALSLLDHLQAPDTVSVARNMLGDPAANVRSKAETVIKKHERLVEPLTNR